MEQDGRDGGMVSCTDLQLLRQLRIFIRWWGGGELSSQNAQMLTPDNEWGWRTWRDRMCI
jgi:hypothetical protein